MTISMLSTQIGTQILRTTLHLSLAVALVLAAGRARADLRLKPDVPDKRITAEAPEARFAERPRYGLVVSLGGSLNRTAAALAVGGRLRLTPRWLVGLDAEWNPWMSLEGEHVRVGAFNAFTTVVRRWSMLSDQFDVRTTMHLGTSTVLFDLYGVPAGTTGLFVGASLLGLEWRATRGQSRATADGTAAAMALMGKETLP